MAVLEIKKLYKSFCLTDKTIEVLKGLDMTLSDDEITVLLGKSGCGKTTLLRIMCGLEQYDSGEITVPKKQHIGMVFQEPRLMPWLTVEENIVFCDTEKSLKRDRVEELIRLVGLQGFEKASVQQLSGGMKQRASLARTLAYEAEWMLMDEPFSALDYFTRLSMQRELLKIQKKEQRGILFVTHNIDEALFLADTILVLQDGKISFSYWLEEQKKEDRDVLSGNILLLKKKILESMDGELS